MTISHYPHGFTNGLAVRDIPIDLRLNGLSNVFWVDSVNGSNGNAGTFNKPWATIAYAVSRCTANQGDKIYVAAGHTETIIAAGTLTIDKAGITIVFLGEGTNKATINYTTAVTASVIISAANVTLIGARFLSGIDALTGPISITGANCTIMDGEWYDGAAKAATDCIIGAATATGLTIDGWKFYASTAGTQKQSNIQLNGVDNAVLKNIDISGDFGTGNIENITDELLNVRFENVKLNNANATPKPGMVLDANCTGLAKNVDIRIASGTTYVSSVAKLNWDGSALGYNADGSTGDPIGTAPATSLEGELATLQVDVTAIKAVTNLLPNAGALSDIATDANKIDGLSMDISPVAGSVARFIASGGTALGTELGDSKSLVDAIGSNGITLVYGAGSILGAIGTEFWVKKTLTSSAIVQAGVDVTGASSAGELAIVGIVLKTDGTGLATGTNFQLTTNNAKGAAVFVAEAVASLGASVTVSTPSITNINNVLESGKKVIAKSTVADCTGAGTIDVYIKFQRLAAGATVVAA